MHFLLIWFLTILVSLSMKVNTALKAFKYIAKKGYKLDIDKWNEIEMTITKSFLGINHKLFLIPGYNLFLALKEAKGFHQMKPHLIYLLESIDAIIPLTGGEIKKFKEENTAFRAFMISIDYYFNPDNSIYEEKVYITTCNSEGEIFYRTKNEIPIIIRSNGSIANLSIIEQQAALKNYLKILKDLKNEKMIEYLSNDGFSYTLKK